jgi:hypothetical protein
MNAARQAATKEMLKPDLPKWLAALRSCAVAFVFASEADLQGEPQNARGAESTSGLLPVLIRAQNLVEKAGA